MAELSPSKPGMPRKFLGIEKIGELQVTDESCSGSSLVESPENRRSPANGNQLLLVLKEDQEDGGRSRKGLLELKRFVEYKKIDEQELESEFYPSNSFSKQTSNKSESNEQSKSPKSPTVSSKGGKKVKLVINPSIKRYELKPGQESGSPEPPKPGIVDRGAKVESPKALKRTPTNKLPIKVFAGKDAKARDKDEPTSKKPTFTKQGKFVFSGLTIDVEEANKQLMNGTQPLHLSRGGSPQQKVEKLVVQKPSDEGKETIDFLRNFYQEQIDKLSQKNESLLRENERLRLELQQAAHQAAECGPLKARVLELQSKLESQVLSAKESPFTGFFGELRQNTKTKILPDPKGADIHRAEKLFNCSDVNVKEFHTYQASPVAQSKSKYESGKPRIERYFPLIQNRLSYFK
jgi:hypothetical protein